MTRSLPAIAALAVLLAAPRAHADGEKIVQIDVVENVKTSDDTVLLIADVEKGDTFTLALQQRITDDLVNSGLFRDVQVIVGPAVGGVKLTIVAKDKFSWVIAPTVYLQPGNKGGGLGFAENNLFGYNKKFLAYAQVATSDSMFIAGYLDPNLLGSPIYFRGDVFLRRLNVTEYEDYDGINLLGEPYPARISTETYLNSGILLGANLWRGVSLDGRLRGAHVSFSDAHCAGGLTPTQMTELGCAALQNPGDDGWDVSTEWKLTYDSRANWYGISKGNYVRLSYERGLPQLGSDFQYWVTYLSMQHAVRIFKEHNFVLKGYASVGYHLPFQQELLSGGTDLRGYRNMEFRGDTKIAGNAEYSVPFFKIGPLAFRGLVFTDVAYNTFNQTSGNDKRHYLPHQTNTDVGQARLGVGAGFRIYVRSVVIPLLGIDWGYAPQAGTYYMYFAVGLTEL
jgi:outer membrane protein assembly factor BamA